MSMDEDTIQDRRREHEEETVKQRAAILGFPYLDMRQLEATTPLIATLMSIDEMYRAHIVPLYEGGGEKPFEFGATPLTPQSLIQAMRQDYTERGHLIKFFLISESAYKAMMLRFDPPKRIVHDDIEIAREGDSETIAAVSQTLEKVSSEEVFDFLIDQADKLGASDIHLENERDNIRIRMRIDGALHPVAHLSRDRYRVIMGELGSRANISAAAQESQSGHMQKDITRDNSTHLLNIRVETVPTMYGQDAVLRLFNFDESMLNLDLLGIPDEQRKQIDEIIHHPRGLVLMVGPTGSGKSTTL